ncbi:MAG: pyridoxal-dependent decarboxylase [Saprospiraceae bacterium]|nr:pyridoxal-dependent decarboxylase [Saprospiraceae bacterium]
MKSNEFRKHAHHFVDWMANYMDAVESYPVKSQVAPKEIYDQIEQEMPIEGVEVDQIFSDFKDIIMPGITHWQSPNFFAYFNANGSAPSILAEMITATLGVQGMKWDTSPASTELEERMMEWLRDAMGIPSDWSGVIQDTGSTSTLASILTAREQKSNYQVNEKGFKGYSNMRVYCSEETHSSIEKGAKIAGIGKENVVKIKSDELLQMCTDDLEKAILSDIENGYVPCCIASTLGTTGTTAMDSVDDVGTVSQKYKIWHHIDAAYVGSALLLPEFQFLIKGIEKADSFFFNPHKWMFTNFDCSAYFVKDKNALINTFAILPEYLKTSNDGVVNNHCDWGVPLGRRFRSLKLWFVIRYYGLKGIQQKLRSHIELAKWLEVQINDSKDFQMIIPRTMNLVCFHFNPMESKDVPALNEVNEKLLNTLNASGSIYLTHTKVDEVYTLRMVIGQTNVTQNHVENAWSHILESAKNL